MMAVYMNLFIKLKFSLNALFCNYKSYGVFDLTEKEKPKLPEELKTIYKKNQKSYRRQKTSLPYKKEV